MMERSSHCRICFFFLLLCILWMGCPLLASEKVLTLYKIQELLEENHPSIQKALETYEDLKRQLEEANSYYSPTLSITTTPLHIHDQGSSFFETTLQGNLIVLQGPVLRSDIQFSPTDLGYSYQLRFSYTFFQDPYLLPPYLKIEDLEYMVGIVEKDLTLLRGEALLEVLQLLFRLEGSKTRYSLALEDLEEAIDEMEKIKTWLEEGVGEKMDLLLKELRVKQRELDVMRREDHLEGVLGDLLELLGVLDDDVIFPSIESKIVETPLCQEEILACIKDNSTKLLEAQRRIEREEKALERELEKRFPQTILNGEYRYGSLRGESYSVMLQMSYPLFDGGAQSLALEERETNLEKALAAYYEEEQKIKERVEDLWKALELRAKDIEVASLHYDIKVVEVMHSEEMVRRGLLDKTKLIEIQREHKEVSLQLLEAEQAYLLLVLELEVLSGTDLMDKLMMR